MDRQCSLCVYAPRACAYVCFVCRVRLSTEPVARVPLSLGLGLALISSYSNVLSGKRSQLGSWSQTMALDTATQPTGGTDLSHYAEATAIDAAAPSTAPPDFHPGVAHSRAPPAPLQPYHRSPGHLTPVHYTTLGTGPTFRDRDLCSTRLPHLCGYIHFQRLPAGPTRSYLRAIFSWCTVPSHGYLPSTLYHLPSTTRP